MALVTGSFGGHIVYKSAIFAPTTDEWTDNDQGYLLFDNEIDKFGMYSNAGDPENVVTADIGSQCTDTTNGDLYLKSTDSTNTGWLLLAKEGNAVNTLQGTANQVFVNGTFGTPLYGDLTLSLPQDLATTSMPTFAVVFANWGSASNPSFANMNNIASGIYFPIGSPNSVAITANGNTNFLVNEFTVQTNKLFQFFAGMSWNYNDPSSYPYNIQDGADSITYVDTTGTAKTVNLPSSATDGRIFGVKDGAGLSASNNITLSAGGSTLIDGVTSKTLAINWGCWLFQFKNGAYYTLAEGLGQGGVSFTTGTANQVLVNGTSGTPVSGAITLTTPQDIGPTSSVAFGNITMQNGGAIQSTTTTGQSMLFNVYNNTLNTYQQFIAVANSTTPFCQFKASIGSASAPGFAFLPAGQANYGMYYDSNQTFLSANGTGWFSVSSGGVSASVGELRAGGILSNQKGRKYAYGAIALSGVNNVTVNSHWSSYTNTGARTATMPSTSIQQGQIFIEQDGSFNAATNNLTMNVNGGVKTINNFTSLAMKANGASCVMGYDGTNYNIIASHRMYSTALGRIVDKNGDGDFTTLAAASAAAVSGDTIFIRGGTYTEDWTPKNGVRYCSYPSPNDQQVVKLIGKMSISANTVFSLSNIFIQTNSDNFLSISGTANVTANFFNCYFNMPNSTGIWNSSTGGTQRINFYSCGGDVGTTGISWFIMNLGALYAKDTYITNSGFSSTLSTFAAASDGSFDNCIIQVPLQTTGSGTTLGMRNCSMRLGGGYNLICLDLQGTGSHSIRNCLFESGTQSCISQGASNVLMMTGTTLNSNNTDVIISTGQLQFNDLTFPGTSSNMNVTTLSQTPGSFHGAQLVFIGTQTANNTAEIIFDENTNLYLTYFFVFDAILPVTAGATLQMQVSNDGGSTWINSGYEAGLQVMTYNLSAIVNFNSTSAYLLTGGIGNATNDETGNGQVYVHKCNRASNSWITGQSSYYDDSDNIAKMCLIGGRAGSTGTNAFRFFMSTGNMTDGTISCYGVKRNY